MSNTETYYKPTAYAGTGAQDLLAIKDQHEATVIVSGGASDDYSIVFSVDGQPLASKTTHTLLSGLSGDTGIVMEPGKTAVGLDITTNVSGSIQLEVRTNPRT